MTFKDKFRFVRQNMKKTRSRVFMTVLATAMGCSFLIVLASVGFGLQKSVIDQIVDGRLLTEISLGGKLVEGKYQALVNSDIPKLEAIEHVKAVTRRQVVEQQPVIRIDGGFGTSYSRVLTMHVPSEKTAGFELSAGRLPENDNEVVVGYNFRDSLRDSGEKNYTGDILGKKLDMEFKQLFGQEEKKTVLPVTVVGIGKKPTREWQNDTTVYAPESFMTAVEAFTKTLAGGLNVEGAKQNGGEPAAQAPNDDLRRFDVKVYADTVTHVKKIAQTMKEQGYASHSIASEMEQVNGVFLALKTGLIIVGTIAILIASIGIYNTMTMAVTERAQDIGIMKAIGANPKAIRSIFLIESSYIGLLGSLFGTIAAYIVGYAVNLALPMAIKQFMDRDTPANLQFSYIPPSLPLICVAISLVVAILSGMRPATRATQVDVLKALRRDL